MHKIINSIWLKFFITAFLFKIACSKFGAGENKGFFFYFGYGSNLLEERIHVQVKGATFVAIGALKGYRLAFVDFEEPNRWHSAAATIEQKQGSLVWGCIWKVPNSFADELDKQETKYKRIDVTVYPRPSTNERFNLNMQLLSNFVIKCRTYQYERPGMKYGLPSPQYKHVIVTGAEEHGLPTNYIQWLRQNFEDNGYDGPVEVKLKALETMPKPTKKRKLSHKKEGEAESSNIALNH
ncbi:hypothetical protein niasHT_039955 [Heterodera trifolii]|uniref:gamma-glutamylcyclotransferase n=1 Tax=Heterodera trifolii TaxID=157864 RepID=A0ABD2IG59_9BILA